MFRAAARFLANVAGQAGTLLVLDDLQWAGNDALELLVAVARTPDLPLRVLGAYRDSEVRPEHPLGMAQRRWDEADRTVAEVLVEMQHRSYPLGEARVLDTVWAQSMWRR